MQNYCDIMPQATGWVYAVDGVQSASCYHTYELALDAARKHLAREGGHHTRIFRRQELNGSMMPIPSTLTDQAGRGPAARRL